jgi:hypothetical protein
MEEWGDPPTVSFFTVYNNCTQGWITSSASMLPPNTKVDRKSITCVFNELGPTPRLCIEYLDAGLIDQYRQDLEEAISNLTTSQLETMYRDFRSLSGSVDKISHKICLLTRHDRENVNSKVIVSPITSFIESELRKHFRTLEDDELLRLYDLFSKVPESRRMGGVFFQIIAQRRFQEGGVELKSIPMVRLPSNRRQWKTSHIPLSDKKLEDLRQDALQREELLIIPSSFPVYVFKGNGPSSIESNIIYVPEKDNLFDSFILMNGFLYLFQFSISKYHSIKPALIDFFNPYVMQVPSMDEWRFTFIHPPDHVLASPQLQGEMEKLHLYSAAFDLKRTQTS